MIMAQCQAAKMLAIAQCDKYYYISVPSPGEGAAGGMAGDESR